MDGAALPRLLYLGDVPVESSYHGSALLYRLLEGYEPDRLRVIEGGDITSKPERRLPGVNYQAVSPAGRRLQNTRLHAWRALWMSCRSAAWAGGIPALLKGFSPQAVMTVAHGHQWVTAAEFARRHRLPLHLIVHDDWPRIVSLPAPFSGLVDRQFRTAYRAAASRLCVSPSMVAEYRQRYGEAGDVLYPSRARQAPVYETPPERLRCSGRGLTLAYAGSINTPDFYRILAAVARALQRIDGRMVVFGPVGARDAALGGLREDNVEFCGLIPSSELINRLRAEADALLVPTPFASHDAELARFNFPSKLTDYTAVGIPILIIGPPDSSAVQWARENPGVADVVATLEPEDLAAAVDRLAGDPDYRVRLATRALEVGARMFSHETAWATFSVALTRPAALPAGIK